MSIELDYSEAQECENNGRSIYAGLESSSSDSEAGSGSSSNSSSSGEDGELSDSDEQKSPPAKSRKTSHDSAGSVKISKCAVLTPSLSKVNNAAGDTNALLTCRLEDGEVISPFQPSPTASELPGSDNESVRNYRQLHARSTKPGRTPLRENNGCTPQHPPPEFPKYKGSKSKKPMQFMSNYDLDAPEEAQENKLVSIAKSTKIYKNRT